MELKNIFEILSINYSEVCHKAVMTVEQAQEIKKLIEGEGCKNLFLTDRKGTYILVVLQERKRADIKKIAETLNVSHLTFAGEKELYDKLGLKAGSVSPLGIINDKEHSVILLIDKDLENKCLLMHPNINTKTVRMDFSDLIKFIEYCKNEYIIKKL